MADAALAAELEQCPSSQNPDGSHCSHSWTHDQCCWCKKWWGGDGEVGIGEPPWVEGFIGPQRED